MCGPQPLPFIIPLVKDGNGSVPSAGVLAGDLKLDFPFKIIGWDILADQSGSIALDVWIIPNFVAGNAAPTVANSIVNGNYPNLAAAQNGAGDTTGWTSTTFGGKASYIRWNLRSIATITFFTLQLRATRSLM